MSSKDFKQEIAQKFDVSFKFIDEELFMGCAMLSEALGEGDSENAGFTITNLVTDLVDEDGELEHYHKLLAEGRNVDMTEHAFYDDETFTIEYQGIKLHCRQSFNRHIETNLERDPETREIIGRDWTFSGAMNLATFSINEA